MKHLKIYERFTNFFEVDQKEFLIHLISKGTVRTPNGMVSNEEVESFTELEIDSIKSLLGDEYRYDNTWISQASREKMSKLEISSKEQQSKFSDPYDLVKSYVVIKLRDEWFLFEDMTDLSDHKYYKCDQIEGLIKCIEHVI